MTLDERLQITFPDGVPADVRAFLRGELVSNAESVNLSIQAQAGIALKQDTEWQIKLGFLTQGLNRRRCELEAAESELSVEHLCAMSAEHVIQKGTIRNALALAVERIKTEIERVESAYAAVADLVNHWKILSDLATARIENGIPSSVLAEMFGVHPTEPKPLTWGQTLRKFVGAEK